MYRNVGQSGFFECLLFWATLERVAGSGFCLSVYTLSLARGFKESDHSLPRIEGLVRAFVA